MTSPIAGITAAVGSIGVAGVNSTAAVPSTQQTGSADAFSSVLASTFDQLQATQVNADQLAAQAATGDLTDVHDYMIAKSEASLAVEMVVSIKNKAVEAFNEIMRMPV
jgi:flagellar hook-basal body complex protein FliE